MHLSYPYKIANQIAIKSVLLQYQYAGFATTGNLNNEGTFLQMVESYMDKALKVANIPEDIGEFYKKPETLIKFNLALRRCTCFHI